MSIPTAIAFFWSGGKDSAMALHQLMNTPEYDVKYLVTTINAGTNRVSMHGLRTEMIERQAASIGISLKQMIVPEMPDNGTYEQCLLNTLDELKQEGIATIAFGDIFLEDLKEYRDNLLDKAGMKGLYPLWKQDTTELVKQFEDDGFKAVAICINTDLIPHKLIGSDIDSFFPLLLSKDVDPCGENGEYHSFTYAGPIFKQAIPFDKGEVVSKRYTGAESTEFLFIDILPK